MQHNPETQCEVMERRVLARSSHCARLDPATRTVSAFRRMIRGNIADLRRVGNHPEKPRWGSSLRRGPSPKRKSRPFLRGGSKARAAGTNGSMCSRWFLVRASGSVQSPETVSSGDEALSAEHAILEDVGRLVTLTPNAKAPHRFAVVCIPNSLARLERLHCADRHTGNSGFRGDGSPSPAGYPHPLHPVAPSPKGPQGIEDLPLAFRAALMATCAGAGTRNGPDIIHPGAPRSGSRTVTSPAVSGA